MGGNLSRLLTNKYMIKVLEIVDTPKWAINSLTSSILKHNNSIEFRTLYIPPRGVDENLPDFYNNWKWADIIHFQYWRTCSQLLEKVPEIKEKKLILTHHNEKNLLSENWDDLDCIVAPTKLAFKKLKDLYGDKVIKISYGIDLDYFKWNNDYPKKEIKIGYVGRIVRWKRLKPVALACQDLGYQLVVMGAQSDGEYMREIIDAMGGEDEMNKVVEWRLNEPDVREIYKEMTVYVGNSWDGRETGTLPMLEAMAIGVPILTTPSGTARDICVNNNNCVILDFNNPDPKNNQDWEEKNKEDIKIKLKLLVESEELRNLIRKNAWQAVKRMPEQKMARMHEMLYSNIYHAGEPRVSVIIPATTERTKEVAEIVKSLADQTYSNIEAIVVWDEKKTKENMYKVDVDFSVVKKDIQLTIKELWTDKDGYSLAMARNMAAIEATGSVLIFCDSRLKPNNDSVAQFMSNVLKNKEKIFYFGNKGSGKRNFVENFSAIRRRLFLFTGMFNERIDKYGGMTQEIFYRLKKQGFNFKYLQFAQAKEIRASRSSKEKKDDIWKMKYKLWKMYE